MICQYGEHNNRFYALHIDKYCLFLHCIESDFIEKRIIKTIIHEKRTH